MAFVSCPPCNQNCDQGRSCPAVIHGSAECRHNDTGMSLRDYFAAKAMVAFWLDPEVTQSLRDPDHVAKYAYEMADAMLKARQA